jgi:hypothetical protein
MSRTSWSTLNKNGEGGIIDESMRFIVGKEGVLCSLWGVRAPFMNSM